MNSKVEETQEKYKVKRYKVQYPLSAYTYPVEARIHQVRFKEKYIQLELTDGRILFIPLWWIPTLFNALPEEREKYEINRERTMIVWDPEKCGINDELRLSDYLGSDENNS